MTLKEMRGHLAIIKAALANAENCVDEIDVNREYDGEYEYDLRQLGERLERALSWARDLKKKAGA